MNNHQYKRWKEEELNLLYASFKNGVQLNELEGILNRSDSAIFYKIFKLSHINSGRWHEVYSFYEPQYYNRHKDEFVENTMTYYENHKREKKKEFKERYINIVRKKPYKREGKELKRFIELRYKKDDEPIKRFAIDLIEQGIIKSAATPYHWVEGYKRPNRNILSKISVVLNKNQGFLENLLYPN